MRRFVKRLFAYPVSEIAGWTREAVDLPSSRRADLDYRALREIGEFNVDLVFDEAMERAWRRDEQSVIDLLGDNHGHAETTPRDFRALYGLIASLKPERALLAGAHDGVAMLYVARALAACADNSRLTAILDARRGRTSLADVSMPDRDNRVTLVYEPALAFLDRSRDEFDLIILEADRDTDILYGEMANALRILRWGGVVVVHDDRVEKTQRYPGSVVLGQFPAWNRLLRENPDVHALPLISQQRAVEPGVDRTGWAIITRSEF